MPFERLESALPVQPILERFSTRLPDKNDIAEAYRNSPIIETKLDISHAKNGELKIVCESAKYAQYLIGELNKIRDEDGKGLNCFYATNTDDCTCFYIASSNLKVLGQETKIHQNERFASELSDDETNPPPKPDQNDKLNHYGVYQSKGYPIGVNKKLSLRCPNGEEGREAIERLLGLNILSHSDIERRGDTFYFDPDRLPYEAGNQHTITTDITIGNGLRRSVREVKEKKRDTEVSELETKSSDTQSTETPKVKKDNTKTYTGDDAKLVLQAAIQMTAQNQYWYGKNTEEAFHRDEMMVFNGTAFKQFGWKGSDHETLSLKWVNDKGEMKLAVSYYSFNDCVFSTLQKAATYLISFNESGDAMTTELIEVPNTEAISIASTLKKQKDNSWKWEPIEGSVYVPTGGEVIDALTEWSKAFHTKQLKQQQEIPTPHPETCPSFRFSEWRKSKNGLEVFLKSRNLLAFGNESAQEMMVQLHNKILNNISSGETETYNTRLHAVKEILKILQEVNPASKDSEDQKSSDVSLNDKQTKDITVHFKTLLQTAPTWKEKTFISKVMIGLGLAVPVVGWLPLLFWDYRNNQKYKETIRSSAKQVAGVTLKEGEEDSYTTQVSQRIKSTFK